MNKRYIIGIIAIVVLCYIGAALATFVISGLLMFAGLVALVESVRPLQWFFAKCGNFIDILMFIAGLVCLFTAGVTVSFAVSVCGLLFSFWYKPFLRERLERRKMGKEMDAPKNQFFGS